MNRALIRNDFRTNCLLALCTSALLIPACGDNNGVPPDANLPPGPLDAAPATLDAAPATLDAAPGSPDASLPDATPADATPADAMPDAAPPDASPFTPLDPGVYWTDTSFGTLNYAAKDGSNIRPLLEGLNTPTGIAVNSAEGILYYAEYSAGQISRIFEINETSVESEVVVSGRSTISGLFLDSVNDHLYWSEEVGNRLMRANLDGSDIQEILGSLGGPQNIAIDIASATLYYPSRANKTVTRINLDGTGAITLDDTISGDPFGVALDLAGGNVYYTETGGANADNGAILFSALDGTGGRQVLVGSQERPIMIGLDIADDKIYWTSFAGLFRANLSDGANIETIVADTAPTIFDQAFGLAVVP